MSQPSHRLTEFIAFFELEPFGPFRDNWHIAQLTAVSFNPHARNRAAMKSTLDYMWKEPPQVMKDQALSFFGALDTLVAKGKEDG